MAELPLQQCRWKTQGYSISVLFDVVFWSCVFVCQSINSAFEERLRWLLLSGKTEICSSYRRSGKGLRSGSEGACPPCCMKLPGSALAAVAVHPPHLSSLDLHFASAGKLLLCDQGGMFFRVAQGSSINGGRGTRYAPCPASFTGQFLFTLDYVL